MERVCLGNLPILCYGLRMISLICCHIQECVSGGISRQKFCQMILCEVELGPNSKKDSCPSVYLEQNTTSRQKVHMNLIKESPATVVM